MMHDHWVPTAARCLDAGARRIAWDSGHGCARPAQRQDQFGNNVLLQMQLYLLSLLYGGNSNDAINRSERSQDAETAQ
jgi:hypothetical protein